MRATVSSPRQPRSQQSYAPVFPLMLAGLAAVGVSFGFARYGYGLFLPSIRADFDLSITMVGLIGSATYVGYLAALILVGALAARVGPRLLIATGTVAATIGTALVGLAPNVGVLAVGLILAGTSAGWIWAPFSDAVDQMLPIEQRQRVLAIIPAGTAFAVVVAGPLAILTHGSAWRWAWLVFAAGALFATVYNLRVICAGAPRKSSGTFDLYGRWLLRPAAGLLYLTALSYGIVGSVYWLLAVEAVSAGAGMGQHTAAVFWTLTGAAGTVAVFSGPMFSRLSLATVQPLLFLCLATAVALLGIAPGMLLAVWTSALLYGPAFMAGSGLLAVWSYRVFPERPTMGFSATVFFLGIGTIVGPAAAGMIVEHHGMSTVFLLTAAVAVATLLARPRSLAVA
ncbi:MFS transporter [Natronoglycomyces albus]|uniref:YbfB/YjiJ family MFS transporter n=1 Tax=Natronoglycomyces albus TaxID=2811108 RepID=A0A895XUP9_9ACTN|nr:MFS transporter [Natronoglycomyces albus]QSB05378.1 YbfB/YjiJ family MFS transporter [Natronoglycomyces albus]